MFGGIIIVRTRKRMGCGFAQDVYLVNLQKMGKTGKTGKVSKMVTEQSIREMAADITKKYHDGELLPRQTVEGIAGLNALATIYCAVKTNFEAPAEAARLYAQTIGDNGEDDEEGENYEYEEEEDD